jgi:glycosyltransferase involved in cell wall biosynthesis
MTPSSDNYSGTKHALSVVIMTYNEEQNIRRCLDSVRELGDETFILDSFSTDQTVDIARSLGARVEQHAFGSYVEQKKRLVAKAKHDWVLCIDADEHLSPELRASIEHALQQRDYDGYFNNRLNCIGDHWIRHGSWYPDRKIRLFDRRCVLIRGKDPHDEMIPQAGSRIGYLKGDLYHHADQDYSTRIKTIEAHSTRAAQALFEEGVRPGIWRILVKPGIRFFASYILKSGWRDGYDGYFIARSEAMYVFLREMKLLENRRKRPR